MSNRSGPTNIYVMDADGNDSIRLTDGPSDGYPDWSPDGKKIAYQALRTKAMDVQPGFRHYDVYVMDAVGTNKRRLTNEGGGHPSWSPDGGRIAYAQGQIYVMDAKGQNPNRITNDAAQKYMPSWSPDGRRIAYVSDYRIWVMDSDGKNQKQLTKTMQDSRPTWSTDSGTIAFQSLGEVRELGIYLVDVTNGAVKAMQHHPGAWDQHPDWLYPGELAVSPEGSRITIWGRLKQVAPGVP